MGTKFYCEYELKDTTAIEDSNFTTTSNQTFGNISKAKNNIESADYATLEEDYFLLDGTMPELPDNPQDVVYFSSALSGADGRFNKNPSYQISFTKNHTSCGLTFYFVGDPPLEMIVRWYDLSGAPITQRTFAVTGQKFYVAHQVENYGQLEIEFTKAKPYRYVKFRYIEYGTDLIFGAGGLPVKDAKLIEEADPISAKIAISKLTYKLIDEEDTFNIGNQTGLHKVLQAGQIMRAYEKIDDKRILLGKYFLSDSKTDKSVTDMNCVDYKGLLDNNKFYGGKVYHGELAGPVIDAIMTAAGITDYSVDEKTRNTPLYGWLKIQTCRKALREVLFACGSILDSSRSLSLNIYKQGRVIQSVVKRSRKFSTTVENKDYISDVSIKFPVYILLQEIKEVAKGSYQPGTYTIELSSPAAEMTIDKGTIIEQTHNYVTFKLVTAADVIISGKKYNKEDLSVTATTQNVQAGQIRSSKSFTSTLLNASQATKTAENILDYYNLQLGIKIKFLNEGDKPADWAEIDNVNKSYGNYVAGFEKVSTDLTGGFVSTAELRGYYKLLADYDYTGELLTGDNIGGL